MSMEPHHPGPAWWDGDVMSGVKDLLLGLRDSQTTPRGLIQTSDL